tara:strand:- start:645 stop:1766 length:1122 start_codon:yes stop_codon:yes gene_type:complete
MNPNEKIQLDDISFDDVISGDGVETTTIDEVAPPQEQEQKTESTDEAILEDIGIENEVEKEEEVEEKEEDVKEKVDGNVDTDEDPEDNEVDGESTVVSEILDKLGYDMDGEGYDDTSEGLANMTADVASKIADDRIDEVLTAFPLVKKHLDYVLAGGESQQFMEAYDPNLDYSSITIEEDDHRSQKAILGDYLELKGHDNDFIEEMLNDFEDTGKLYAKSEAARGALAKHQTQQRDQMIETQQTQIEETRKKTEDFWANVSETIEDSDSFAGISVPKRDKNKFFDYLSTPVNKQGNTQRDIDHANADMDIKLAIDYLMYTGFDLSDIISSKAKTQNAKTLRERIGNNETKVKSTRKSTRRSKNVDFDNLDLSI